MAQRPDDWDILYFGGIHAERPRPVGDSLAQVSRTLSTFAYAIRARAFDAFLEIDPTLAVPVDDQLTRLQGRLACYCIFPHAAWVEPDHSDIQGREDNHWYIRESIVLGDHCLDDMKDAIALAIPARAPGWRRVGTPQIDFLVDHLRPHLRGLSVVLDDSAPRIGPSTWRRGPSASWASGSGMCWWPARPSSWRSGTSSPRSRCAGPTTSSSPSRRALRSAPRRWAGSSTDAGRPLTRRAIPAAGWGPWTWDGPSTRDGRRRPRDRAGRRRSSTCPASGSASMVPDLAGSPQGGSRPRPRRGLRRDRAPRGAAPPVGARGPAPRALVCR